MLKGFMRPRRARFIALFAMLALLWQTTAVALAPPADQGTDNPICSAHPDNAGVPVSVPGAPGDSKAKTLCGLCSYCPGGHAAGLTSAGVAQPFTITQVVFRLVVLETSAPSLSAPFSSFLSRAPPAVLAA